MLMKPGSPCQAGVLGVRGLKYEVSVNLHRDVKKITPPSERAMVCLKQILLYTHSSEVEADGSAN